ncbi:MAG TPA: MFS transporter [Pseudomonadota bacterium]|nr:MFS transporter [Pseudomonadota bacterium]
MSSPTDAPTLPPLSQNRDFRRFWYGQTLSNLGDSFAMLALPLLVLEATGSVTQMGIVTALTALAQIAMSLFSGLLLDRLHRRRLMIGTDLLRMALYLALPILWRLGAYRLPLLYFVTATGAALGNLFSVGQVAAVANLVPRAQVTQANSRLQATSALSYVIGPLIAGAVCARFGTAVALWVDAASFAVSAASLALVRFGPEGDRPQARERGDLLSGYRFTLADPLLRRMIVFMAAVSLLASAGVGAAVIDLLVFHLRSDLGQGSQVVGFCLGLSALGALLGALLSPRLRRRAGFGACFFGGTALQAAGLFLCGVVPVELGTILGGALWSAGLTTRAVAGISLRQERAPDHLLGRVIATAWTTSFAASSAGALIVTQLAAALGTPRALSGLGLALGAVALVGRLTWVTAAASATPAGNDPVV